MATILEKVTFNNGVYAEILDIDVSGSSLYIIYRQLILVLTDGSSFSVGTPITGDSDNGNDGAGIVREKIDVNTVVVELTSGTFIASNGVDDVDPYVGDNTTIVSIEAAIKSKRTNIGYDEKIGAYVQ